MRAVAGARSFHGAAAGRALPGARVAAVASRAVGASLPGLMAPQTAGAKRFLNLHEYQSKDLLEKYGVSVQKGKVASTAAEAKAISDWILEENPEAELIVKAQIHAGGRGKGVFLSDNETRGVHICTDADEAAGYVDKMLGNMLTTKQTGPEGQLCTKVLINEGIYIDKELYFAILMDRAYNGPVVVTSKMGGMDIEAVAEESPEAINSYPISIADGMTDADAAAIAEQLGFSGAQAEDAAKQFQGLYEMFIASDSTQVEINPLAVGGVPGGPEGIVICVDAKLNFDDNASFRQAPLFEQRDTSMEDPRDVAAEEAGLNYIGLDGNIGCLVNGAGLAMATMDIIKMHGGEPANFLDVGGGATKEQVVEAFKILTSDPNVKAILVNIFGGIMKCDTIAAGIAAAAKEVGLELPLVVRLEGTNVEAGREILETCGVDIITGTDLDDAAKKGVAAIA